MTPSIAPPSSVGSFDGGASDPHDIHSELGEVLRSAVTEDSGGDETPGGEDGSEPSKFTPTQEDAPPGEGAGEETGLATTNEPFPLSEDGQNYLVPKAQLSDYTGLREYSTAVQEFFPTVSDAQAAQMMSSDLRSMQYDYASGDPANIDRMLEFWIGNNAQDQRTAQRYRDAFSVMAQRVPQFLQKINPQAHDQLTKSLAQSRVEKAYLDAAMENDPQLREGAFKAAQGMDWVLNRSYKSELPKHDPNAAITAQQQEAEKQRVAGIEKRESQLMDRDFNSFNQSALDGPKIQQVYAEIDKVLAPVKGKYDESEYGELRQAVMKDLTTKLTADREWFMTHQQEFADLKREFEYAWKNHQDTAGLKNRAQFYINDLLVRARRAIPSIAAPRITKATARTVTTNKPKQATTQQRTQAPASTATSEKTGHWNPQDDSEFTGMFKVR